MRIKEKKIILKNGALCTLRSPGVQDAAELLGYLKKTSGETDFMIRYPEEVTLTLREEQDFIRRQEEEPGAALIAAFAGEGEAGASGGRLAASCGVFPVAPFAKYRHRAGVGIAVLREFWGQGVGGALLGEAISAAREMGVAQLELEVACGNRPAISLYRKFGFSVYGARERSMRRKDGSFEGEYLMLLRL